MSDLDVELTSAQQEANDILMAADAMLSGIPLVTIAKMAAKHDHVLVPKEISDEAIDVGHRTLLRSDSLIVTSADLRLAVEAALDFSSVVPFNPEKDPKRG